MSSPIDPVTGLPMVGVPDVVSQIPLGVQVVPWDDTKAVDRPQGGPAYPNDIINTFAWLTGENIAQPGTIHAGTMTADRRLRVDTGSAGGGGLSPQIPLMRFFGNVVPQGGGEYTFNETVFLGDSVIVGWDIAHMWTDASSGSLVDVSPQTLKLEDTVTLTDIWLGTWFNQYFDGTGMKGARYSKSHFPAVPFSLADNTAQGGGDFNLIINGRALDASLSLLIYYYAL